MVQRLRALAVFAEDSRSFPSSDIRKLYTHRRERERKGGHTHKVNENKNNQIIISKRTLAMISSLKQEGE